MSAIAAAINAMRAKGLSDSDILDIVAEMAAAGPDGPVRSARQERNARYYQAKARLKASENRLNTSYSDVSDANSDAGVETLPPPVPPLSPSPRPLTQNPPLPPTNTPLVAGDTSATSPASSKSNSAETPKARGSPDRATRLPADWSAPPEFIDFAIAEGFTHDDIVRRIEPTFRDHWLAASGASSRKADWLATWRNWIRRDAQRRPSSRQTDAGRNGHPGRSVLGAYQRASAHVQAENVLPPKRPGTLDL